MNARRDPSQLCVIGAAEHTVRNGDAPEPLVSWVERAHEAAAGIGNDVLRELDSVQVVFCHSWPYDDPPGRLAEALGSSPRHRHYSGMGGTTPQELANATARAMQRGDIDLALICSAESLATLRAAKKRGEQLPWSHRKSTPFPWEPPHAAELAHEVFQAWETFPLWDTARRARLGATLDHDAREAAEMMATMSATAALNPHAWRRRALDATTIGSPTPENRYVGWPYTKSEVAVMDVDMSAALLLATTAKADALGVSEDQRMYLTGWAYAEDPWNIAERADMSASIAMATVGSHALSSAGIGIDDVDMVDLYSCFPSSVRFGCDALGLAPDDPRGLTITGGLPFAGGPASGYMTHAIATAYRALQERSGRALVTGVGMHMAKHNAAVWSSTPDTTIRTPPATTGAIKTMVEANQPRKPLLTTWEGPGIVCAYTVAHGRDGAPQRGLLVLDTTDGRALARVHSADLLADAESRELVGQAVHVTNDGKRNSASW